MPDLLPCPFCGSTNIIIQGKGRGRWSQRYPTSWRAMCAAGDCPTLPMTLYRESEALAIAAWNRRVTPADPEGT